VLARTVRLDRVVVAAVLDPVEQVARGGVPSKVAQLVVAGIAVVVAAVEAGRAGADKGFQD
jgi:hypothetical protein